MKMHEHDQELIMALAEGDLAEDAAAVARAEIESCDECSADFELQVSAIAMLDQVPPVYLTATESARLHSSLKEELSLATPKPASPRRSVAWSRFLPAAGVAAALLLVIVSLPSLLGGGSDDSSDETVAAPSFEADATETSAAASLDMERDGTEEMAGGDNAAAEAAPPAAQATTEAPLLTTTTAAPLDDVGSGGILGILEFLGPIDQVDTAALLDQIVGEDIDLAASWDSAKSADPFFAGCLTESVTTEVSSLYGLPADSEPFVLGVVVAEDGEEGVLVAYVPAIPEETVFAVVSPNCASITPLP